MITVGKFRLPPFRSLLQFSPGTSAPKKAPDLPSSDSAAPAGGLSFLQPAKIAGRGAALEELVDGGSIEQKYLFAAGKKELILDWMQFQLAHNPALFVGPVSSLYYDTPTLDLYREVRNGDYLKSKVRLRWYRTSFASDETNVSAYLEVKRKCGVFRHKQRASVELPVASLRNNPFDHPLIVDLPERFLELCGATRAPLVPALIVEYQRYRFVDPRSGARISLDVDIRCRRANPALLPAITPVNLGCGVLEIKGEGDKLPRSLIPLSRHLRRSSFSKYAQCCECLIAPFLWREPA